MTPPDGPLHATEDVDALDRSDPLAAWRERFDLPPGVLYLDGNSLGPLPRSVPARIERTVRREWGEGLIRSWNEAGWIDLAARVGARIGRLVGAEPGSVTAADSTSVNLYKLVSAALALNPGRGRVVSDTGNFPTDLYIGRGIAHAQGAAFDLVAPEAVADAIDETTALVMLTHVDYRTGRVHDMAGITRTAHEKGALVLWDLAHSAGALPVDLAGCGADLAVGCSYKYLNGGPGAPAWLYVAPRHQARAASPLTGWLGHEAPFAFDVDYRPAEGVARFVCGTPGILSLSALDAALDLFDGLDMEVVRAKSLSLQRCFLAALGTEGASLGLVPASPADEAQRGSQVSLRHPDGYAVMQALIARGVIGDFRAPDILRFGFCPLFNRHEEARAAGQALLDVLRSGEWREERFAARRAVT